MIKRIVHKSSIPIYMTALTWILYAVFFPLAKPLNFLSAIIVTTIVGMIGKVFCKDVVEEIEVKEKPVSTGNAELDKMIEEGNKSIAQMRRLNADIKDPTLTARINRLEELTSKIFEQVKKHPEKLPQIRMFMNYYLPTTLKILGAYDTMSSQGVQGTNISSTMTRIEGMMSNIVAAFEKQLDNLFDAQAMDISTDITVLEQMMAREGLKNDELHDYVHSNKTDRRAEDFEGTAATASQTENITLQ